MRLIFVNRGEYSVSRHAGDVLAGYQLGSSLAIAVVDAEAGTAGLLVAGPDSRVDLSIAALWNEVQRQGAVPKRTSIRIAGGAGFEGKQIYLAVRKNLWKMGLFIQAEAVGAARIRNVRLEVESGRFLDLRGTGKGARTGRRAEPGSHTMPYSILIADDSPAMRKVIARVISMSGFDVGDVLTASDGLQALSLLKTHAVDLILTDINMPRANGEQLVRELRQDARLRKIPVVVVSTDATQARLQQMVSLGANGYVVKPFTPETIRAEMERALGGVCA
ncbi:MAG TPA: response regulator [Bryobacteraceae bacterium]|nr:response regulator [Bryobacteraceae bacterium]